MAELSMDQSVESEETVSMEELSAFLGKMAYPSEWQAYRDKKSIHAGFNGWAALFSVQWFLCRRLYWQAPLIVLFEIGFPVIVLFSANAVVGDAGHKEHQILISSLAALAFLVARVMIGFWANVALYKKAVKEIRKVDALNLNNEMHLKMISSAGKLNIGVLAILYISILILRLIFENMS